MRKKTVYRRWTAWELEYLRNEYPNRPNAELAEWLHRPPRAIQLKALKLGVQKSPEYMANSGFKRNQFKKGHAPFNKGRERRFWASDESQQRMAKGQFKPGQVRDDKLSGLIASNRFGGPCSTRGVAQQLRAMAAKAGVPVEKCHPHAFRHFFAKMYLKRSKTKDVTELADLLGHSGLDTTMIYIKRSQQEQQKSFNKNVDW